MKTRQISKKVPGFFLQKTNLQISLHGHELARGYLTCLYCGPQSQKSYPPLVYTILICHDFYVTIGTYVKKVIICRQKWPYLFIESVILTVIVETEFNCTYPILTIMLFSKMSFTHYFSPQLPTVIHARCETNNFCKCLYTRDILAHKYCDKEILRHLTIFNNIFLLTNQGNFLKTLSTL